MAKYERKTGDYTPTLHAVNITKWQTDSAANLAPDSSKMDGEMNAIYDALNEIWELDASGVYGDISVAIAQVKTNQDDIAGVIAAGLPSQTGNAGKALTTDGSTASWGAVLAAGISTDAVTTVKIQNDAVTLAKLASGTAGNLITYDASGNPAAVSTGTAGQVLTSNGSGAAPTFQNKYTPSFKAYLGSTQSIANSATKAVAVFDTEEYDSNSAFDAATTYRFTPQTAGKYLVVLRLSFESSTTSSADMAIMKNTTEVATQKGFDRAASTSSIIDLNGSTDYVEAQVKQQSGGALNLSAGPDDCEFSAFFLGP